MIIKMNFAYQTQVFLSYDNLCFYEFAFALSLRIAFYRTGFFFLPVLPACFAP